MDLQRILPSKIFDVIERAGISTPAQVILLSVWDIKKFTNLRTSDIMLLKNIVSENLSPPSITCDVLLKQYSLTGRVTTGCVALDELLKGGFRRRTITEIYGESGSGKTQVALQSAAHNWSSGTVFICTEDLFPIKRFQKIQQSISNYSFDRDYGQNTFVEHLSEANDLMSCLRVRLPKLLEKSKLSLLVLDSVAAPFRSEYTNYIQRAEELRELAVLLTRLAQAHNLAVLCINQVTASFDKKTDDVIPSLGLAWSNMVSTRLCLKKTNQLVHDIDIPEGTKDGNNIFVRKFAIEFASDLPNNVVNVIITPSGIKSL